MNKEKRLFFVVVEINTYIDIQGNNKQKNRKSGKLRYIQESICINVEKNKRANFCYCCLDCNIN